MSDLLTATEAPLVPNTAAVAAGRLTGGDAIGRKAGRVINQDKVGKHFAVAPRVHPAKIR